jgi:uncharacterized protein YndB with AHSA1/START domain
VSDVETVERFIPAQPEAIFAIISNPRRHHEIDGSGTVRDAKDVPDEVHLGSRFGMSMKLVMPYSMVSEVVEYEPNRRIAWQTRPPSDWAARLGGGRIWRYELEPREGGTLVRESWDITHERLKVIVRPARKRTRAAMAATLERIERILSPS